MAPPNRGRGAHVSAAIEVSFRWLVGLGKGAEGRRLYWLLGSAKVGEKERRGRRPDLYRRGGTRPRVDLAQAVPAWKLRKPSSSAAAGMLAGLPPLLRAYGSSKTEFGSSANLRPIFVDTAELWSVK
jgi:hypothetical protein